mgnify:CR=1 FL=1
MFLAERFDAAAMSRASRRYGLTYLTLSAPMLDAIIRLPDDERPTFPKLRVLTAGGAASTTGEPVSGTLQGSGSTFQLAYQQQAAEFGVTLSAVTDGPAPAVADADRVLQVVSNLVENALRLTPAGGEVRVVAEPGVLRVEDTGPGLADIDRKHAFERFYLHERYGRERPVGTGLGLAIVKELTQAMGGMSQSLVGGPASRC